VVKTSIEAVPFEAELAVIAATACSLRPKAPPLMSFANLIYLGRGVSSFSLASLHFFSNRSPLGKTAAHARPANQIIRQMKDPPIVAAVGLNYSSVGINMGNSPCRFD